MTCEKGDICSVLIEPHSVEICIASICPTTLTSTTSTSYQKSFLDEIIVDLSLRLINTSIVKIQNSPLKFIEEPENFSFTAIKFTESLKTSTITPSAITAKTTYSPILSYISITSMAKIMKDPSKKSKKIIKQKKIGIKVDKKKVTWLKKNSKTTNKSVAQKVITSAKKKIELRSLNSIIINSNASKSINKQETQTLHNPNLANNQASVYNQISNSTLNNIYQTFYFSELNQTTLKNVSYEFYSDFEISRNLTDTLNTQLNASKIETKAKSDVDSSKELILIGHFNNISNSTEIELQHIDEFLTIINANMFNESQNISLNNTNSTCCLNDYETDFKSNETDIIDEEKIEEFKWRNGPFGPVRIRILRPEMLNKLNTLRHLAIIYFLLEFY